MKKKIFIDSDVLLDVIFKREPFFIHSHKILSLIEQNIFQGYTSSLIIANCYYIISSNSNAKIAHKSVNKLRALLTVLPLTDKEIHESLNSNFKDFEDGVEYFIAINNGIRTIITRNISDYKKVDINIFSPNNFLNLQKIKNKIEKIEKTVN
jgi:predicted nucleic acid-binding protein